MWLVTQPAHAMLSGTLAAHWGNASFARPGGFGVIEDPERLRREVVLGVAQHDNGWWEWEAAPEEGPDGLPLGLRELMGDPREGMQRWRMGVQRLAERHPYASLLISDHAAWLYAAQYEVDFPAELVHPIQSGKRAPQHTSAVGEFLAELRSVQSALEQRLRADAFWRAALEQRLPHSRLLQILDAFSLALCSAVFGEHGLGRDAVVFPDVPGRSWNERVEVHWTPLGGGRVALAPYPFGEAPLTVSVLARRVVGDRWWREVGLEMLEFHLERG